MILVEAPEIQPTPKRSVVFEPVRHLPRTLVPLVVTLASDRVATIVITAVGIATIIVSIIIGWRSILFAPLVVGGGFGNFQEQQSTGQD
jgi:hypothetical protein